MDINLTASSQFNKLSPVNSENTSPADDKTKSTTSDKFVKDVVNVSSQAKNVQSAESRKDAGFNQQGEPNNPGIDLTV